MNTKTAMRFYINQKVIIIQKYNYGYYCLAYVIFLILTEWLLGNGYNPNWRSRLDGWLEYT